MLPPTENFNETEIVRLKERTPAISGKEPRIVLAKVEAFQASFSRPSADIAMLPLRGSAGVNTALVNRSKWEVKKLFSLTTMHREFAALMAAPYFDLFADVIKARVAPKPTLTSDEVRKAMQGYQVNEPQARAILGSLAVEGFSLIQGPPGTGKTKNYLCVDRRVRIEAQRTFYLGAGGTSTGQGRCYQEDSALCAK